MLRPPKALSKAILVAAMARLATLLKSACAILGLATLTLAILGACTYEAPYIDASGSHCHTFLLGAYEADLCAAPIERQSLIPPHNQSSED